MKNFKPSVIVVCVFIALIGTASLVASEGIVPWFQISITSYLQDTPGVAANPTTNQFLVVWEDWRGAGIGTDLYAQVVNSDSTMDGGNFLVSGADDWQRGPVVGYSPVANRYLVVWEDWQADDIYGRLVNANGTTSGSQFPIAMANEYQWNPDLAYGSTYDQFLVVFDDDRLVPGDNDISGQFVNSDGTLSGSNFTVSGPSSDQLLPAVAYNSSDDQFLVVWQDDRNTASDDDIYGRVINANGTYEGAEFPITTAGPEQGDVDIAYAASANLYLVVWEQSADIYGRLVNADKTFVGSEFQIASSSSGVDDPVVEYDPHSDQFLVLWHDETGWDSIHAQQVGVDGSMLDEYLDLISGTGDDQSPSLAINSATHQFMAAWQRMTCHTTINCDDDPDNYDKDIFGAFYQATGNFKVNIPLVLKDFQPSPPPEPTATVPIPTSTPVTPMPTATNTPTPTVTPTPTPTPDSDPWVTIVTEDFEGTFPVGWTFTEGTGSGPGVYHWARRDCRAYGGSYSGWAVGGGADGIVLPCGSSYPNDVRSLMTYGDFSLADATDSELHYKLWINSEINNDLVCPMASLDGVNFYGDCISGNSGGWIDQILDLGNVNTLGNLIGQSNVWIGIYFYTNSSIVYSEGAHVDDILLRKCTTGNCTRNPTGYEPEHSDLITFPLAITVNRP